MSFNNKTYQPLQAISIQATEDLPQNRFISFSGGLCADNTRALGVTEVRWVSGQHSQVVTLGTIVVEAAGTIAAGDDIASATTGKARKALNGELVNGRALDSASSGGFVKIKLVP
jgi:hypothetical protein